MLQSSLISLTDFLEPLNIYELSDDTAFKNTQIGSSIEAYQEKLPDVENADIILLGCNETRGSGLRQSKTCAADAVRSELYKLFQWHTGVKMIDFGNIKTGATPEDSYAAVQTVLAELIPLDKKIVLIGGSHDLTVAQYKAYTKLNRMVDMVCVDAFIDLNGADSMPSENFLLNIFTEEPNFLKQYNHIGFQSYFVHPNMLETIDRLRFDCFRVGKVKENMEEMEPVMRNANLLTFDISAIQNAHAPANVATPNGFTGEESCSLFQYAGLSQTINTVGVYGYEPEKDIHALTAKQIAQNLWYFVDGVYKWKQEAHFDERHNFNEFHLAFAEMETSFLQSLKTGRWWMKLPNGEFIACSHKDYLLAKQNEIPERWLRAVERS
ncbi:MAG: formimidoylglutamase [Chitinophagaceae bacterium]|jgi:arginase family enzyme|nr:formimidoylglutamase [Chitinophagaceae bacterium]